MKIIFSILMLMISVFAQEISYGTEQKQKFDFYDKGTEKVFFFVHGGAWKLGDKKEALHNKEKLPFTLVNVNYRLNVDINSQIEDIYMAYKKAKELNPKREFILTGHSAGAHLILMTVINKGLKEKTIAFDTSYDYTNKEGLIYKAFKEYNFEDRKLLSPFYQIDKLQAPLLIVSSRENRMESNEFYLKGVELRKNVDIENTMFNHREVNTNIGNFNEKEYHKYLFKFIKK